MQTEKLNYMCACAWAYEHIFSEHESSYAYEKNQKLLAANMNNFTNAITY